MHLRRRRLPRPAACAVRPGGPGQSRFGFRRPRPGHPSRRASIQGPMSNCRHGLPSLICRPQSPRTALSVASSELWINQACRSRSVRRWSSRSEPILVTLVRGPAALEPFKPEVDLCCRSAAGAADCHISDNHKSQDPSLHQTMIRQITIRKAHGWQAD